MPGPEGNHVEANNGPKMAPPGEGGGLLDKAQKAMELVEKGAKALEVIKKDPAQILSEGQKVLDGMPQGGKEALQSVLSKVNGTELGKILQNAMDVKSSADVVDLVVDYMLSHPEMVQKAVDYLPAGGKLRLKERATLIQRGLQMYGDVKSGKFNILSDSGKALALLKDVNAELGDSSVGVWIRGKIKEAAYGYIEKSVPNKFAQGLAKGQIDRIFQ